MSETSLAREAFEYIPSSGSGWCGWTPEQFQYRLAMNGAGDYAWPLNTTKHGYPVPTSAVRQLTYTGINTWNLSGYDYSQWANTTRRTPLEHQEPKIIINYSNNNPSAPVAATPINIATYALSTGMIYVGQGQGNWGGIQTGMITPGGNNAY